LRIIGSYRQTHCQFGQRVQLLPGVPVANEDTPVGQSEYAPVRTCDQSLYAAIVQRLTAQQLTDITPQVKPICALAVSTNIQHVWLTRIHRQCCDGGDLSVGIGRQSHSEPVPRLAAVIATPQAVSRGRRSAGCASIDHGIVDRMHGQCVDSNARSRADYPPGAPTVIGTIDTGRLGSASEPSIHHIPLRGSGYRLNRRPRQAHQGHSLRLARHQSARRSQSKYQGK